MEKAHTSTRMEARQEQGLILRNYDVSTVADQKIRSTSPENTSAAMLEFIHLRELWET
jgi:hypothetical protein